MKKRTTINFRHFILSGLALLVFSGMTFADPVTRSAAGANAAAIQAAVDQFRADLGGALNPNNGQVFTNGRREVNWDGVPDNLSAPNAMPNDFFNVNSKRGVVFSSTSNARGGDGQQPFFVSSKAATGVPVRFGNIDPSYTTAFQVFSQERLFISDTNVIEVNFFVPGTTIPATVSGFGAVFADVDTATTKMHFYDANGKLMAQPSGSVPAADNGLSFLGVSFNGGERIARVVIVLGNKPLAAGNVDNNTTVDVVATDDFIYGEPRALQFHPGDFDGDGFADPAVFRPSTANYFILNSGNNTVNIASFGAAGDVPVNGDFDGDSRADIAIFRPSDGSWWINRSSSGETIAFSFGQNGDRPTPGDFDKDGKTDISVWRPSNGNYFVLRSSNNSFFSFQWGQNGDLPVGAAISQ